MIRLQCDSSKLFIVYCVHSTLCLCAATVFVVPLSGMYPSIPSPPRVDANIFDIREYSVLVTSAEIEVSSILQHQGFDPTVFAVASCLVFLLIAGFVFISRWDALDRESAKASSVAFNSGHFRPQILRETDAALRLSVYCC